MSINIYLDGEKIFDSPNFVVTHRSDPKSGQRWENQTICGMHVNQNKGVPFVVLYDENDPVPSGIVEFIKEVSLHEFFPLLPKREAGIYRLRSAEGEVTTFAISTRDQKMQIRAKAKNIDDLRELYRMIRIGSIRPDESFEGQQSGLSQVELEAELERTKKELSRLDLVCRVQGAQIRNLNSILESMSARLRTFCETLQNSWKFLCDKKAVRKEILSILNNPSE